MSGIRRLAPLSAMRTGNRDVDRALEDLRTRTNHLIAGTFAHAVALEVDLVEGLNRLGHGLGVPVSHFVHAALPTTGVTVANAQAENPRPERQLWVRMAGVAEVTALLFLFQKVE